MAESTDEKSSNDKKTNVQGDDYDGYDKSKFDHIFSGWSVWIEPEDNDTIDLAMAELQTACGGPASGAASFVPHVTLMYNLPPFQPQQQQQREETSTTANSTSISNHAQDRLQACWDEFSKSYYGNKCNSQSHTTTTTTTTNAGNGDDDYEQQMTKSSSSSRNTTIVPTEWYYFHYPKSADDGKGFGCSIALLLIKRTDWLVSLQETCRKILGPDERSSNFIPHLSLVYAPEDRSDYLKEYVKTKQQQNQQQQADKVLVLEQKDNKNKNKNSTQTTTIAMTTSKAAADLVAHTTRTTVKDNDGALPIKYLSLWSTQGRIQDWYRIAKIPIS